MSPGPKIYSETRSNDDTVCVRAFEYVTNDDDFNTDDKTPCVFRGLGKSPMIWDCIDNNIDYLISLIKQKYDSLNN